MEVGALMVGRIKNHKKKVSVVHRGEEKGMFEFGGSTVVLLTEPGKLQTDEKQCTRCRDIDKDG